ncbi:aldo/keto reductase [Vararia minispora EC-137]|uniref:Aldo/keto reductase n=1 Tax=Vararia minispora EC-137 TaxID=1314806 RepID=A0ACB8QDX3_9AGAM|nr:aldo/keto reductase [Vararia minispora EC-137]
MSNVPTYTLNNGEKIPALGLGCWMGELGGEDRAYNMCKKAIEIGYRHIDTAAGYGNEEAVGRAIRDSGVPRSKFYVTTKLRNMDHGSVRQAFEKSLASMNIDYIDLYLIHWPQATTETWSGDAMSPEQSPTVSETWAEMEKLLETGKIKSIGVSNFSSKIIEMLLSTAKVVPAVNQIQLHPYLPQHELLAYMASKGIHATAYSSLGQPSGNPSIPNLLSDNTIQSLAEKYDVTTGQVLLSWGVQRGTSVIPKSENEDRLRKNFTLVKLEDQDMKALDDLHKQPGLHRSLMTYHENGVVFGWTHEQLGWDLTPEGLVKQ